MASQGKKSLFYRIMAKFTATIDPKLEKYRPPKKKEPPFTPKTEEELIGVIKRTPKTLLDAKTRNLLASAMAFDKMAVSVIMSPKRDMEFLHETDFLGPLTFDKLYKSGATRFPVLNQDDQVCGVLNTNNVDPLAITEETPITKYMSTDVFFVRADYTLEMLLATFLRTDSSYCIVINRDENIEGFVTLDTLMFVLFGRDITDSFDNDSNASAVAKRSEK
jgi:CBS domain containing-hemolysin-like protein